MNGPAHGAPRATGDADLAEAHGTGIKDQKLRGEQLAKPRQELESFKGCEIGHRCGDGSDNRELTFPAGGNLRVEACKAGRLPRNDGRQLAFEIKHRRIDKWFALVDAFPVEEESLLKEGSAIENNIRA